MNTVVHYPHPALSTSCTPVTVFDQELEQLSEHMFNIMSEEHGIGLAANQLAILKKMFVMSIDDKKLVIINPEIIQYSKEHVLFEEGCLSFPGIRQEIKRSRAITLQWQDIHGFFHEETFDGLAAICIQHEMDHLKGITFLDKLSSLKKELAIKKYKKLHK